MRLAERFTTRSKTDRSRWAPRARSAASQLLGLAARAAERSEATMADARRLFAFLAGRARFRPRPDDIYVVSYPRSGTTWMQFLLLQLTGRSDQRFSHISELSPWFERSMAVGSMTAEDFERFPGPRILKSHLPHGWLPRPGRRIYVWRNGPDVAVSYYHFYRTHLGWQGDFAAFVRRFLRGDLQYRSWFDHVHGWLAQAGDPDLLIVRYEDLQQDRAEVVRQVSTFCRLPLAPGDLEKVVQATSFAAMKEREAQFDHITALMLERGLVPGGFIRSGLSGEGELTLDPDQRRAFERQAAQRPAVRELRLPAFLH